MDFSLSEQEEQFKRAVRDFAAKELAPRAAEIDAKASFPYDLLPKMGDMGLFGILLPTAYGGSDAGLLNYLIAVEETSAACASTGYTIVASACPAFAINTFGEPELKERLLPKMASGQAMGSVAMTEPSMGEDAGAVKTSAVLEGDHYRLNGNKIFISNAGLSDIYVVLLNTAPDRAPSGLTFIVVEKGTPGFHIGKPEGKMGLRGHPDAELTFEDCLVPKRNVLCGEGRAWQVYGCMAGPALVGTGISALGIAQAAYEKAVAYAKERVAFGQVIARHQAIQMMIFDMAAAIETARLLCHRVAYDFNRGQMKRTDGMMAKLVASEAAIGVTYKAMQIHGGYGYSTEYPLERHFRDARAHTLHMQTPEIARTLGTSIMLDLAPSFQKH